MVTAHPGEPLELIDEQIHVAYELVLADEFQRLKSAAEDKRATPIPLRLNRPCEPAGMILDNALRNGLSGSTAMGRWS